MCFVYYRMCIHKQIFHIKIFQVLSLLSAQKASKFLLYFKNNDITLSAPILF